MSRLTLQQIFDAHVTLFVAKGIQADLPGSIDHPDHLYHACDSIDDLAMGRRL